MPIPHRLLGRVRLYPEALADYQAFLDPAARHRWVPIAPRARVHVEMAAPALRWSGPAYFDSNAGDEPLENAFHGWDWSRATHRGGTTVLYHVVPRQVTGPGAADPAASTERTAATAGTHGCTTGGARLALHFDASGAVTNLEPFAPHDLPATRIWRIPRSTYGDPDQPACIVDTLEDTPFYARSLVAASLEGDKVTAVHESLSLDRFRQRWVQMLLPFRMPRVRT